MLSDILPSYLPRLPAERQRTPASEGGPFNMFDIAQGKPLDQPGVKKEVRMGGGSSKQQAVQGQRPLLLLGTCSPT